MRVQQPQGSQGTQICLVDRWFNPVDPVVSHFAQHVLRLDAEGCIDGIGCLKTDTWAELTIRWNDKGTQFRVGDGNWNELPMVFPTRNGISYLHLQSAATGADPAGLLIESVSATKRDVAVGE